MSEKRKTIVMYYAVDADGDFGFHPDSEDEAQEDYESNYGSATLQFYKTELSVPLVSRTTKEVRLTVPDPDDVGGIPETHGNVFRVRNPNDE